MPTALRYGPYAFVFFSSNGVEPLHIHVKRDRAIAKYWLEPVKLATNRGFKNAELRKIGKLVQRFRLQLIEAWHDYFDA